MRYCHDLVKRLNYPAWLNANATIRDTQVRNAVLSVLAFDAEISGLSRVAKSPAAAEMRYEFWRIGLRKLREGSLEPNGHPLLDSLAALNASALDFLQDSLNGRSGSVAHPDTLADFDSQADRTLLPIYSAISHSLLTTTCNQSSIGPIARAQFAVRKLRGLQATLNGKKMNLNDFIPTQMQRDRVKLYDIVKLFVEHAQECTNGANSSYEHAFFKVDAYCVKRWLDAIKDANYDLRAERTLRTGTKHDGLLPLLVYFQSFK